MGSPKMSPAVQPQSHDVSETPVSVHRGETFNWINQSPTACTVAATSSWPLDQPGYTVPPYNAQNSSTKVPARVSLQANPGTQHGFSLTGGGGTPDNRPRIIIIV